MCLVSPSRLPRRVCAIFFKRFMYCASGDAGFVKTRLISLRLDNINARHVGLRATHYLIRLECPVRLSVSSFLSVSSPPLCCLHVAPEHRSSIRLNVWCLSVKLSILVGPLFVGWLSSLSQWKEELDVRQLVVA